MKKLKVLAMLFCIVSMGLVSSCNKDKNENDSGSVGLVGD